MKRTGLIRNIKTVLCMALTTMVLISCGKAQPSEELAESTSQNLQGQTQTKTGTDAVETAEVEAFDSTLTIYCLKAGAADTFVLISDNHVTLIDTGLDKKGDELVAFLQEKGVTRIDELIITHYDKDHVGGADHVINNFEIGTVYTTYQSKESDDITAYMEALSQNGLHETVVTRTTSFAADGISFTIYPPMARVYEDSMSNNSSLVIMVKAGDYSMLFAGDAEEARINELLKTEGLECTILKVPHHGRYKVNFQEFIDYVSPQYAIITSSKSEPEDQEVLDILEAAGAQTYLTRDGDVTITITPEGVTVSQ